MDKVLLVLGATSTILGLIMTVVILFTENVITNEILAVSAIISGILFMAFGELILLHKEILNSLKRD